jgi:hypothetical protein
LTYARAREVDRKRRKAKDRARLSVVEPARAPIKRIPLRYVVIGVTLYCALAWAGVIAGIHAGAHALFPRPASLAASNPSPPPGGDKP